MYNQDIWFMLRDHTSHSSIHLVRQWCATGRHSGGFTCWFRSRPGWLTRLLCLTPSNAASAPAVNPAECHPVQLATQAGSTRRPALLISFSIFILVCTGTCTLYVPKEKKVQQKVFTSKSHYSYYHFFSLNCVIFSVHPVEFNLPHMRGAWMPTFNKFDQTTLKAQIFFFIKNSKSCLLPSSFVTNKNCIMFWGGEIDIIYLILPYGRSLKATIFPSHPTTVYRILSARARVHREKNRIANLTGLE